MVYMYYKKVFLLKQKSYMLQYTLSHALDLRRTSRAAGRTNDNFEKYLSLALRLYVFPALDKSPENFEASKFSTYCDTFMVAELRDSINNSAASGRSMKQPLFSTSYAPRDGESTLDEIEYF